jgi:hypothetical protein
MDESETETFRKSTVERDRDETESLVPLVSRPRQEHDDTLTNFSDFQYFGMRSGPRLLEKLTKRRVQDRDYLKI